ncbi:hypothetical protein CASFOL_025909 [Castilleja foliolosa]|uniref:Mediator of RNA polymerase II transcription subunit 9 n=1 Tax=Castilleja foliolosa TaxID=1961234 RepID=A0ABD3CSF7_9LAMI
MIPNIQSHSNPQQQQFNQQQQFLQQFIQSPPQSQPRFQQQPPPQQQSLASHFHLLHLVENLAEVTENGTRDQQTDALFEKCQQLLNTIGGTITAKSTTVGEQKRRLEETRNLLAQRRDLISNYRSSVEELINS